MGLSSDLDFDLHIHLDLDLDLALDPDHLALLRLGWADVQSRANHCALATGRKASGLVIEARTYAYTC